MIVESRCDASESEPETEQTKSRREAASPASRGRRLVKPSVASLIWKQQVTDSIYGHIIYCPPLRYIM